MITLYYYIDHTKDTVTLMAKSCRLNDGMLSTEIVTFFGARPGLVVKGDDSLSEGREFESFLTLICC